VDITAEYRREIPPFMLRQMHFVKPGDKQHTEIK
jgi:hypothetical protein